MLAAATSNKKILLVFKSKLKTVTYSGGFFQGFRDSAYTLGKPELLTDQEALTGFLARYDAGFWDMLLRPDAVTPGQAFVRMLKALRSAMAMLAREPILVDTGQYTAKYQIRSFADVEHELSNSLSQLPNFHARARFVSTGEHVLKTKPLPPGLSGEALAARIQRIKRRMWEEGSTRYYKEIEKEIQERESTWQGTDDADEPPPSRF
jgi:hypothetical protein